MLTTRQESQIIENSKAKLFPLFAFCRLDGPGWWVSAACLSAGSLVGSIGLGLSFGIAGIWIQAISMLLGVIILIAVSQISLSTQQSLFTILRDDWNRPFAYLIAATAILTSFTWCMPQFKLCAETAVSTVFPILDNKSGRVLVAFVLLLFALTLSTLYSKQGPRSSLFQWIIKLIVLFVSIASFISLVTIMSNGDQESTTFSGAWFPNYSILNEPSSHFSTLLDQTGDMKPFWENEIVSSQKEFVLLCFASTLGINLIFCFPMILLNRSWKRTHQGFAKYNLFTTAFFPFAVTSICICLLSCIAFNHEFSKGGQDIEISKPNIHDILLHRIEHEMGTEKFQNLAPFQLDEKIASLSYQEKQLASLLTGRTVNQWILSISQLGGNATKFLLCGMVIAICLSTVVILMIVNGHLVCEIFNKPHKGFPFQVGSLLLGVAAIAPFIWSDQNIEVSDPTYFISLSVLPFALISCLLILNNVDIMGNRRPMGISRFSHNLPILISIILLGSCSFYLTWSQKWNSIPTGKILLCFIGIILLTGYFSLRLKKLSQKVSGLEMKLNQLSDKS